MHIKFRITLEDNTIIESHDDMWNVVRDHCHAVAPLNSKKWVRYELISDDYGLMVGVDFDSGIFNIRGQIIHPASKDGTSLTFIDGAQELGFSDSIKMLNGTNYFPIYGRRHHVNFSEDQVVYFCGWKKKIGNVVHTKVAYVWPSTAISLT